MAAISTDALRCENFHNKGEGVLHLVNNNILSNLLIKTLDSISASNSGLFLPSEHIRSVKTREDTPCQRFVARTFFHSSPYSTSIMSSFDDTYAAQQNRAHRPACKVDPDTWLPDKIFARLSLEDKRTWSQLGSDDARCMILATSNAVCQQGFCATKIWNRIVFWNCS